MKIKHALEWNIPLVSAEWLWDCVRTGQVQPFGRYYIPTPKKVMKPSAPLRNNKENLNELLENKRNAGEPIDASSSRASIGMASEQSRHGVHHAAGKPAGGESSRGLHVADPPVGAIPTGREEKHGVHLDATSQDGQGTPLQDISPEVNSSAKNEVSDTPEVLFVASGSGQQKGEDIGDKIAELLRHQQGQLRDQSVDSDYRRRPRCGQLGRAALNVSSHASLSFALSGASSGTTDEAGALSLKSINNDSVAAVDDLELLSQERSHTLAEVPLASQVVTYEDPEAQRQKERVMRKLRGLEGTGTTPKRKQEKAARSIGVARDSAIVKRTTRQKTYR
jgi:DNA replication regulator DPB11